VGRESRINEWLQHHDSSDINLQPHDKFIHGLMTLREQLISVVAGRLANIRVTLLAQPQRGHFSLDDAIRRHSNESKLKEYGMGSVLPSSLTDSNEYWKEVATKCFVISTQFGG
jgi:hypothetical protein